MARSRSFSIYLLKPGYSPTNALEDEHGLESKAHASALPKGAVLFILDAPPRPPWWRGYFGIRKNLDQASKAALVFVPVGGRWFALCFGHVAHILKDDSYEYDFGLKVTLNSVDPDALKSTDALEPGVGRRQRTQVPIASDLTFFDFDRDSSILRRLTGRVKSDYYKLFKYATGASNLRVSTAVQADSLVDLCKQLLTLYNRDDYRSVFPEIQNISPVKDPAIIERLDGELLKAVRKKEGAEIVPELVDYDRTVEYGFSGLGRSLAYDDLFIDRYYEYLERHEKPANKVGVEELKKHAARVIDENGTVLDRYSIYRSLVFDTRLGSDPNMFHLSEGNWYKVETTFVTALKDYLDPFMKRQFSSIMTTRMRELTIVPLRLRTRSMFALIKRA